MVSVRAAVEPLNTALGNHQPIFLSGSFAGLPLINQALARENPIGNGAFRFTVRALVKVLGEIRIQAVLDAVAQSHKPPPSPPGLPPAPAPIPPAPARCGVELDSQQPSGDGFAQIRIFGSGMMAGELVDIFEGIGAFMTVVAQPLGFFEAKASVGRSVLPRLHTFHARGETTGRVTNDAGINV